MESAEYRVMYTLETEYWWYRNLHDILSDALQVKNGAKLLDAGCGTGGLMLRLGKISPQRFGFDIAPEAAPFWRERGISQQTCRASINEIPYPNHTFDAVISADILECEGVDDKKAYAELVRVTKPGGLIVIVVPAYQWMMTEGHHQAVHAVRRYNRQSVRALAKGLPITIKRLTHAYAALFPLIGGTRLWLRLKAKFGAVEVKSELQPLAPALNNALYQITNLERHLLRYINMPFGSSLIMVAVKNGR